LDIRRWAAISSFASALNIGFHTLRGALPMTVRNEVARILVVVGAIALFTTATFHLKDYSKDALRVSSLNPHLQAIFRTMHLLVGWQWIVVGAFALLAAFTQAKSRWLILVFCGLAVLVEAAVTLTLMGVFLGTELMGSAAILIITGGLLYRNL
jgi:hypothetical protein